MTNKDFRILFNDLPRKALVSSASSENVLYPHQNLFYGSKTIFWESDGAVTDSNVTIDLGSGNEQSARYFVVSGVDSIIAQTPGTFNIELRASTDNFSSSNVLILQKTSIVTADLIGTNKEELAVFQDTLSTAYRYWRVRITTTNAVLHRLRKCYFGDYFNFGGRSPRYPYQSTPNTNINNRGFLSDSGTSFTTSSGRPINKLELSWHGISDSVREDFYTKVANFSSDYPIYLFEPANFQHTVVRNKIMLGWASFRHQSHSKWKNSNEIIMEFIEDTLG